ncbi:MAG: UbiX family flavin prenyltransferase [Desulfovibrio sp.]|nr:MAG: UbiX family flavin prenyltransferase [Desulfovibrio sp.]
MAAHTATRRIVLAMTGASGVPYTVRLLEALSNAPGVEPHLIVSDAALKVMALESDTTLQDLSAMAAQVYTQKDLAAGPASGSWLHAGMVVCPCSMASLAAIANGFGANLIHRAADVTLKEGRKLILVTRETPLNQIHIQNMLQASQAGAVLLPACPGFYHQPQSIGELVDQIVGRVLDRLEVEHQLGPRWAEE